MQIPDLNGILPPVPTPFNSRGDLDLDGLAENVSSYNQAGLVGYIALGSNGEAVHLTKDESAQVVKTIKEAAAAGRAVVAGVNEFTSRAALEAIHVASDLGADAALVVTPYYYKGAMTQEALLRHYTAVADNSPLPVLLYNVPQNTGVVIEPETIASLASHENIIGIKDSAGNMAAIADTIRRTNENFFVMVGNGGIFYPSLVMGAAGAVLAVACVAPSACVELYKAVRAGEYAKARELQNRIGPLSQVVTAGLGVAGLKAAMEIAGLVGGPPRSPLMDVGDVQRLMIRTVMRDTGLFPAVE
jgi:4-hydroxy-2-oxoglutarate aldolase